MTILSDKWNVRRIDAVLATAGVVVIVLTGAAVVGSLGSSGPETAHVESYPIGPDRPADLNATSVSDYIVEYEQRRLYNGLLAVTHHTMRSDERITAECAVTDLTETAPEQFRATLQCNGRLESDSEVTSDSYTVEYLVTQNTTQKLGIESYRLSERGSMFDSTDTDSTE